MEEQPVKSNNQTELSSETTKMIISNLMEFMNSNREEDRKLADKKNIEMKETLMDCMNKNKEEFHSLIKCLDENVTDLKESLTSFKVEVREAMEEVTHKIETDNSRLTNINPIVEEKPVIDLSLILESVPNFANLGGTILPPEFVEQVRTIDKLHSMEWIHWKPIFFIKLTDAALVFFQSRMEEFISLEDFLSKFLNYFWSIERQFQLHRYITSCRYERNVNQSMVEFCRRLKRLNSMLTGSLEINAKDLILLLLDKLPFSIRMTMSCNESDDYRSFEDNLLKLQITAEQEGYDKANRRIGYDNNYSSQYCGCETPNSPNRQTPHHRSTNDHYCRDSEMTGKFYSSNIHVEQNVNTADRRQNTISIHNLKTSHPSIKQCHQSSSTIQHSHPDHSHERSKENDCVKVRRQQCEREEMGRRQSWSSNQTDTNTLEPEHSNCSKSSVIDLTSTENIDTNYISPIYPQSTTDDEIFMNSTQNDTSSILQTAVSRSNSSLNPEATSFVPEVTATPIISKSSVFSFRLRPASPDITMQLLFNEASMSTTVEKEVTHTNQDDMKWTMDNELPYSSIDETEPPLIADDHTSFSIPTITFTIIEDEELIGQLHDEISWTMDDELPYCDHEVEGCLLMEEDHSCSPKAVTPPKDICDQIQEPDMTPAEVDVCIHAPEPDLTSVLAEEDEGCSCHIDVNLLLSSESQDAPNSHEDPCHDVNNETAFMEDTKKKTDCDETKACKQPDEASNQDRFEPFQTTVIDTIYAIFILLQNWLLFNQLQKRRLLPGEKLGWGLSPPRSRRHQDLPPHRPQNFKKRCLFRLASSGSKKFYHRRPGRHKTLNGGNKVNYQPMMPRTTKPTQGRRFHLLWPHRYKGLTKRQGTLSTNEKCKEQADYDFRPHLRLQN